MSLIWTKNGPYRRVDFGSEADLEASILEVRKDLFGDDRFYLNIKKKIGAKGGLRNIPDGYLLDLSSRKPRLYVVENELASHEPLRHIAVQILEFSLSFETDQRTIKGILFNALQGQPEIKQKCEEYAASHEFRNLDHLLDFLIYEGPFAAPVVIDKMPEELETVLARRFQFGVEVLELGRYENSRGERFYHFAPFLADLASDTERSSDDNGSTASKVEPGEIDTIVVPAREDGFQETFLDEKRWYAIRIHGTMRPQIKYIAAYQVAPISAITYVAPVRSIEPWKDTEKFVVNFAEPAKKIGPVGLVKGSKTKAPQSPRYTTRNRLDSAKTLDDIW
jgi:hypothetical protein